MSGSTGSIYPNNFISLGYFGRDNNGKDLLNIYSKNSLGVTGQMCSFINSNTSVVTGSTASSSPFLIAENECISNIKNISYELLDLSGLTGNGIIKKNNTYSFYWAWGNALSAVTTSKASKTIAFPETTNSNSNNYYLKINYANLKYSLENKFNSQTNSNFNLNVPSRFISLVSKSSSSTGTDIFGTTAINSTNSKLTATSLIIKNQCSNVTSVNFDLYLGGTTDSSAKNNIYNYLVEVKDSNGNIKNNISYTDKTYSSIKNCSISNLSLNDTINIILKKYRNVSSTLYGASDKSILLIDLQNLLYVNPDLKLTLSEKNNKDITYGHEDQLNFNVEFKPNNINNDSILGENLTLNIYKSSDNSLILTKTLVLSSNSQTFNSLTSSNLNADNYYATLTYTTLSENNSLFPDNKSHYNTYTTPRQSFEIKKQNVSLYYDKLNNIEYPILDKIDFNSFKFHDEYDLNPYLLPNKFTLHIIKDDLTEYVSLSGSNNTNDYTNLSIDSPYDIGLKSNKTYNFYVIYDNTDSNINIVTLYDNQNISTLPCFKTITNVSVKGSISIPVDNNTINTYTPITLTAYLENNSDKSKVSKLSGQIHFNINNHDLVSNINSETNNYNYSTTPNDLELNHTNLSDIVVSFIPTDSNNTFTSINIPLSVKLITPNIVVTNLPSHYLYDEMYVTLNVNGFTGHNDAGNLKLFNETLTELTPNIHDNNNQLVSASNILTNTTYNVGPVKIVDLIGTTTLNDLNTNYATLLNDVSHFTWKSNLLNVYNEVLQNISVSLSKTPTSFNNVNVSNSNPFFNQTIQISGNVRTVNNEILYGTVSLYYIVNGSDPVKYINEATLNGIDNSFNIDFYTGDVNTYDLYLTFTPLYENLYLSASTETDKKQVIFKKITVYPILKVYNVNDPENIISYTLTSNNFNVNYTDNFKLSLENLSNTIDTSVITFNLSGFTGFTCSEPNVVGSTATTDSINAFSLVSQLYSENYPQIDNVPFSVSLSITNYDESKYIFSMPSNTVTFKPSTPEIPLIKSMSIYDSESVQVTDMKMNFNGNYNLYVALKLVNHNISFMGSVNLYFVGHRVINGNYSEVSYSIDINDKISFNSEDTDILITTLNAHNLNIHTGNYNLKCTIIPDDNNLSNIVYNKDVEITRDILNTIDNVSFSSNHGNDYIQFTEDFTTTVDLNNPGLDGTFTIYCLNLLNGSDQLISYKSISSNINDENYKEIGPITMNFNCDPISFHLLDVNVPFKIYIDFQPVEDANYNPNTFRNDGNFYELFMNKIPVFLNSLTLNDQFYNYNEDGSLNDINKYINQSIEIKGSLNTTISPPNSGRISIIINYEISDEGTYNASGLNLINFENGDTYINVDENGNFIGKINLDVNCNLKYNETFQLVYLNDKDYDNIYFNNYRDYGDTIPGKYNVFIMRYNPVIHFNLNTSPINSNYNYSYHEDSINFQIDITLDDSYDIDNSSLDNVNIDLFIKLADDINNLLDVNNSPYKIPIQRNTNDIKKGVARLSLNPKNEGLNAGSTYQIFCKLNSTDIFNETEQDNTELNYFNIIKSTPKINVTFYETGTKNVLSSNINYEESVDIFVEIIPFYDNSTGLQNYDGSTYIPDSNISGTISLFNTNSNDIDNYERHSINNAINVVGNRTFDNQILSSEGLTVTYAPKNNVYILRLINEILVKMNVLDKTNYNDEEPYYFSFVIDKYQPKLIINTISPTDKDPNLEFIYNPDQITLFNGAINYDEHFTITSNLDKNIPGTLQYSYVLLGETGYNNIYSLISPIESGSDETTIISTEFNYELVSADAFSTYNMKGIFTPTEPEFYLEEISEDKAFNIYEATDFGVGTICFEDQKSNSIKNIYFNENENFNITATFNFNTDIVIEENDRVCLVDIYYDMIDDDHKISTGINKIVWNIDSSSCIINFNKTVLNYRKNAYTLKALFTPIVNDVNNSRNDNYPIMTERSPLTLIVKPFITSTFDETVDLIYSNSIETNLSIFSNKVNLNKQIDPYSTLYVITTNDNYSFTNSYSLNEDSKYDIGNSTYTLSSFESLLGGLLLIPGNYTLNMYISDDSNKNNSLSNVEANMIYRSNILTYNINVLQKDLSLNVSLNNYFISYRDQLVFNFNLTSNEDNYYPIDDINGGNFDYVTLTFNKSGSTAFVTNIYSKDNEDDTLYLTKDVENENLYSYTLTDSSLFDLVTGIYELNVTLTHQNYIGNFINIPLLVVNKNKNCSIKLEDNIVNDIYNGVYNSSITIKPSLYYNNTEEIIDSNLYIKIDDNDFELVEYNNGYTYVFNTNNTNTGIYQGLIFIENENYSSVSYPFQINISKENVSTPSLEYNLINETEFTLTVNPLVEGNISFYEVTTFDKLPYTLSETENNVFIFDRNNLKFGYNEFYAVINNSNYDIKSNSVSVNIDKPNNEIILNLNIVKPNSEDDYYYGNNINLVLNIENNNTNPNIANDNLNGFVNYYRVTNSSTEPPIVELVGTSFVEDNTAILSNYELNNVGDFIFYAVFNDFVIVNGLNNSSTSEHVTINVKRRAPDSLVLTKVGGVSDYLNIVYITSTVNIAVNDSSSNPGMIKFSILNDGNTTDILINADNNGFTKTATLELLLENSSEYVILSTYMGNDNYNEITEQDSYNITPSVKPSDYYTEITYENNNNLITATLNFVNENCVNNYILNNTGFMQFIQNVPNSDSVTTIVPLEDGMASAYMLVDNGYDISNIVYVDKLENPDITIQLYSFSSNNVVSSENVEVKTTKKRSYKKKST